MAKKPNAPICARCESPFRDDAPFCGACGGPSPWASHDERVAWEVRQWRASRAATDADKPQMMLVRTEDGYEPMPVARYNEYVWDQPLHPEREKAPSAAEAIPEAPSAPVGNGNGHAPPAAIPRSEHSVAADPAAQQVAREVVAPEPHPPAVAPASVAPASVAPAPAAAASTAAPPAAPSRADADAGDDRVTISRKAVAIGLALVLGLPLGTKLLGSVGDPPASTRAPSGAAPAKPAALVAARSGFHHLTPDAVRYAVILQNPNKSFQASGVTVSVTVHDAAGRLVGAGTERVALVPAASATGVAGAIGVSGPAARIKVKVGARLFEETLAGSSFRVKGVRLSGDVRKVSVRAAVSAVRTTKGARVVAVYLDRAGRVIGGDFAFADVPAAPRSADVVITTTGLGRRAARALIYVLSPR